MSSTKEGLHSALGTQYVQGCDDHDAILEAFLHVQLYQQGKSIKNLLFPNNRPVLYLQFMFYVSLQTMLLDVIKFEIKLKMGSKWLL